jgi:hypothetical protein
VIPALQLALAARPLRRAARRTWAALVGAWGALVGLAPHLIHHVGPPAGAALVAGAGGTALFAAIGLLAGVPFLVRLRRRFGGWRAPAVALAAFAVTFSLSSLVVGPAIAGAGPPVAPGAGLEGPTDHAGHHR